jgi:site-specific recombinase XerD
VNTNRNGSIAISDFLQSLKRQKVSESTLKAYCTDLRGLFDHLKLKSDALTVASLERIQPDDIESYLKSLTEKNLRFSTIKRTVAAIRRFFSFLLDEGIITNDPSKSLTVRPVAKNALTGDQVLALFEYLIQHQKAGNECDIIRYRRDEVIFLLMILYGVRQYQLSGLKLSQLKTTGKDVLLTVKRGFSIKLDSFVLQKLRDYLSVRKSNADTIFLEPLRKKPVDHASMRTVFTELSYALGFECSPKSLYDTHLHLQRNPEERHRILERLSTDRLQRVYGAVSNA